MDPLPTITLDNTLADLYKIGQNGTILPKIGLVLCGWSAGMDLGLQEIPRNRRYVFHEPLTTSKDEEYCVKASKDDGKLREIQAKVFSMVAQRDCYMAGDTASIFFVFDDDHAGVPLSKSETLETYACIAPHQRPRVIFCNGPKDLPQVMQEHGIDQLAQKCPIDSLEALPAVQNMATWTYMNSKLAIRDSGLPTPKTDVFEPVFCDVQPEDCCNACAVPSSSHDIPTSCSGSRLSWLKSQVSDAISVLKAREVPFVVKCQQSVGGGGTWILLTEQEKQQFLQEAETIILPKVFSDYRAINRDLNPASLAIMDYVPKILHNWGVTFFITRTGETIFLCATEQKLRNEKFWYGSEINYHEQAALEEKFSPLLKKVTNFLFHQQKEGHRYFGALGVDILETPPPNGAPPSDEEYLIVDMNVRAPGSLLLPFLKSYFTSPDNSRGPVESHGAGEPLVLATNQFLEVSLDRPSFIQKFHYEFYVDRSIVISAWYYDAKAQKSHVGLVVAGRNEEALQDLTGRIDQFAQAAAFE